MEFARRKDVKEWAVRTGLEMMAMKTGEANMEYLFHRRAGRPAGNGCREGKLLEMYSQGK